MLDDLFFSNEHTPTTMAFTLAHPAAVIPLRRLRYLALLPLIVGSVVPDIIRFLPYALQRRLPFSHSPIGTLLTDMPAGYLLLLVILLFRRSLVLPLWEPHRTVIANGLNAFYARPHCWLVALPSLLVGSWTHILWDRFTHDTAWTYRHMPVLYQPLFPDGEHELHLYHVLQYVTSVVGLFYVAWCYCSHLRQGRESAGQVAASRSRVWLLVLLAAIAMAAGAGRIAFGDVELLSVYARLREFLRTAIVIFALQYFASCLVLSKTANQGT